VQVHCQRTIIIYLGFLERRDNLLANNLQGPIVEHL
jgi:hypothetical protein